MPSPSVSKQTLQRLPTYLSYLKSLRDAPKYVSATGIAEALNVNHVVVTNLVPVVTELLPVLYAGFLSLEVEDTCQSFIAFDSPPKQTGVPLFVYHCTYLI